MIQERKEMLEQCPWIGKKEIRSSAFFRGEVSLSQEWWPFYRQWQEDRQNMWARSWRWVYRCYSGNLRRCLFLWNRKQSSQPKVRVRMKMLEAWRERTFEYFRREGERWKRELKIDCWGSSVRVRRQGCTYFSSPVEVPRHVSLLHSLLFFRGKVFSDF